MKARWHGELIAESNDTVLMENNHYFPRASVQDRYLLPSDTHTTCLWKDKASYSSLLVNGQVNTDAAWYYPQPMPAAMEIKDRVAFWKGVEISE
ncbi:MAG: DUF427 domain-containing protein [Gammaproteobacteria bacterium]|nr:DUF427 domain-containing protein [Gammaproteobacteria bacterium]